MSKLARLRDEIKALERGGLVKIVDGTMTILSNEEAVRDRIMQTGPWGALLLMGKLDDVLKDMQGGRNADDQT
ncbi:hypothetical protein LCGC14_2262390 [marine sediment metagenome]|uniref:Uncharacterized protein n=1 Tax=marine sediment metagenome TaxID=412755 RepID=A0A0F9CZD6_9ZZZZ